MTLNHLALPGDRREAEILLAHCWKKDRLWILTHPEITIPTRVLKKFYALLARRARHEPIAYLTGKKEFYGRAFSVTTDTLIPRPETELIIDLIGASLADAPMDRVVWDVGTGSGAIAITLAAEHPQAKILATDIRIKTLAVAKKNAKRLNVSKQITFLKSNLLQLAAYRWLKRHADMPEGGELPEGGGTPPLLVCANLPYLPKADQKKLARDVTKFEPSTALFSGKDGLDLITRFLRQLSRHLPEWGYRNVTMLFEFDPPQATTLKRLARSLFPSANITIHKDLAGKNRVLQIYLQAIK